MAEENKAGLSERIDHLAGAFRAAGDSLGQQQEASFSRYSQEAAETLDRFSRHVREQDLNTLFDEAQGYARRSPAVFLGGSLLAGVALARLIRATVPTGNREQALEGTHRYPGTGDDYPTGDPRRR